MLKYSFEPQHRWENFKNHTKVDYYLKPNELIESCYEHHHHPFLIINIDYINHLFRCCIIIFTPIIKYKTRLLRHLLSHYYLKFKN